MKVSNKDLFKAVSKLTSLADDKSSMKILSCLKFESNGSTLEVTTTDLTTTMTAKIECEGQFIACLPAKPLLKILSAKKKSDMVEFYEDGDKVLIMIDKVTFRLMPHDYNNWPWMRNQEWDNVHSVSSSEFLTALRHTLPAISNDYTRPHINSLLLSSEGKMVSTDGHRLHSAKFDWPGRDVIIRQVAVGLMKKAFDTSETIEIYMDDHRVGMRVVCGMWTIETRLIQDQFPPYDQVIPKDFDFEVELNTRILIESINVLLSSKDVGARITVNGVVSLQTNTLGVGEIETIVDPLKSTHEGDDSVYGLNLSYLKDAVNPKVETTKMKFQGPLDPIVIENDNGEQSVVMPKGI